MNFSLSRLRERVGVRVYAVFEPLPIHHRRMQREGIASGRQRFRHPGHQLEQGHPRVVRVLRRPVRRLIVRQGPARPIDDAGSEKIGCRSWDPDDGVRTKGDFTEEDAWCEVFGHGAEVLRPGVQGNGQIARKRPVVW